MKPYPSYKNSGVEWIGEIPNDWSVKKVKYLFSNEKNQISVKEFEDNEAIHYSIPNVQAFGKGQLENGEDIESTKLLLNGNEILVSRLNPRKKTICISEPNDEYMILGSGEFIVLIPYDINLKYSYYQFVSGGMTQNLDSLVESVTKSHQRVRPERVFNTLFVEPPLPEQNQIVSFLDHKTQKIDELIEKIEKKIELLKEKRTALINHCVTKGLPAACLPDFVIQAGLLSRQHRQEERAKAGLNPNVEMKDSGVEWIGDIPSHWKFLKLWLIVKSNQLGGNYDSSIGNDGHPLIKMGNIGRGKIVLDKIEYLDKEEDFDNSHFLNKGDFLFNTRNSRDLVGKVTLWNGELESSLYNSNIMKIKFKEEIFEEYMCYLFNTKSFLDILKLISKGTTNVSGIYYKDLSKIEVIVPPSSEQTQIIEYLDEQTQKIDSTIEKETQRIELLKEYRQSLISEVVTGKIDLCRQAGVRDWKE